MPEANVKNCAVGGEPIIQVFTHQGGPAPALATWQHEADGTKYCRDQDDRWFTVVPEGEEPEPQS